MALPTNADIVVVRGFWWDEVTRAGVSNGTVSFQPVPLSGPVTPSKTPNLRDLAASGYVKTRARIASVDSVTGYFATLMVASNDPDLDAYGGRQVIFASAGSSEPPFIVEVPYNAPTVTVDQPMTDATGLTLGSSVRAVWLADAALITTPTPSPPINYLTSTQTISTVTTAIDAHDEDPDAHVDMRAALTVEIDDQITSGIASGLAGKQNLDADLTAIAGLDSSTSGAIASDGAGWIKKTYAQLKTALGLVKADVGLGNVDNTADTAKPVSTAQQTALNAKAPFNIPVRSVATNTTAVAGELLKVDATGGTRTITPPASPVSGTTVVVVKTDASANAVVWSGTVNGDSGGAQITTQYTAAIFVYDGSQWIIESSTGAAGLDPDLVAIAALSPTDGSYLGRQGGAWTGRTPTQVRGDLGVVAKGDLVLNVKDYGAVGNGTTDDTTAVQAAITACQTQGGGTVFFPVGHYKLTSELQVSGATLPSGDDFGRRGVTLRGVSAGGSVLAAVGGITAIHFMPSTSKMICNLEDLEIVGPGSATASSRGVYWDGVAGSWNWSNLYIHEFETGAQWLDSTLGTAVNVNVRNCVTGVKYGWQSDILTWIGGRIDYCDTGIWFGVTSTGHTSGSQEENNLSFIGCRISNHTTRAFFVDDLGAAAVSFKGCYFEGNGKEGDIGTTTGVGPAGIEFDGCYFNTTSLVTEGISVQNSASLLVQNCKADAASYTTFLRFYNEGAAAILDWRNNSFYQTTVPVQYGTRTFDPGVGFLKMTGGYGETLHANGFVLNGPLRQAQVAGGSGEIWDSWTRRSTTDNTVSAELQVRDSGGVLQMGGITNGFITATSVSSLPTAGVNYRGCLAYVPGNGTTTGDTTYVCQRDAVSAYSWVRLDNIAGGGGGGTRPVPPLPSGYYVHTSSPLNAATSNTLGNGSMRVVPWVVNSSTALSRIGAEVTVVGDAGSKFRLAIYADDGAGRPGALVVDAGQIAGDTVGSQELTISQTLSTGLYWIGGAVQAVTTTQPTMRTVATSWVPPVDIPLLTTLPAAGLTAAGYTMTSVTGAAPGTFAFSGGTAGSAARVFVKVA